MKSSFKIGQPTRAAQDPPTTEVQIHPPHLPLDLELRPRLWARLDAGRACPLTLVVAPAGYGKTTAVAAWVEQRRSTREWADTAVAWYSIDPLDNQLRRFCSQLVAAMRIAHPDALRATQQMLDGALSITPEYLAMHFVADVAALPGRQLLILDDYHHIYTEDVHTFWERVLHYAPAALGVVIASRQELPFPVARLRSQGRMAEVGLLDLQLSAEESQQLLARLLHGRLTPAINSLLHRHVEGWVAGIRLLALSLRDHPDLAQVAADLPHQPDRLIADFFMDEVLAQQPAGLRDFMLCSSLLPLLDADLCVAALDVLFDGQSRACFDMVVRSQLFVIPLDARQNRYRYHDLFRAMLQERLSGTPLAAARTEILLRAARWYARHGDVERALECALHGDAAEEAVNLLTQLIPTLQAQEQWRLLERYLALLPAELVDNTPALLLARGWLHQYFMQPQLVRATVRKGAALLAPPAAALADSQLGELQAELGVLQMMPMIAEISLAESERCTLAAIRDLPANRQFLRGNAYYFLARHYHRHGMLEKALALLEEASATTDARANVFVIRLLHARCLILVHEGLMQPAVQAAELCLQLAQQANLSVSVSFANMIATIAAYMARDDEFAITRGRTVLSRPHASIQSNLVVTAFLLIRMWAENGADAEAAQVAADFRDLALGMSSASALAMAQMLEAESAILSGRAAAARAWLAAFDPGKEHPDTAYSGWVWAMGLLHLGTEDDLAAARAGLAALSERCRAMHVNIWVVEFEVLLARVCAAQGDTEAGLAAFQAALHLGWTRGCRRSFLDPDPAIDRYLAQLARRATLRGLVREVEERRACLAAQRRHTPPPPTPAPAAPPAHPPTVALSRREIEILTLLAQSLSPSDVARQLGLSEHTVRNHARKINAKLEVRSRREAIRRARSLGLLPTA